MRMGCQSSPSPSHLPKECTVSVLIIAGLARRQRWRIDLKKISALRQRRKSVYNFRGTDTEKIGSASAEGAKLRLPKGRSPSAWSGVEPQKPTRFLTF